MKREVRNENQVACLPPHTHNTLRGFSLSRSDFNSTIEQLLSSHRQSSTSHLLSITAASAPYSSSNTTYFLMETMVAKERRLMCKSSQRTNCDGCGWSDHSTRIMLSRGRRRVWRWVFRSITTRGRRHSPKGRLASCIMCYVRKRVRVVRDLLKTL